MCPGRAGRHGHPIRGDAFPNSLAVGPAGIQLAAEDPLTFEQLIAKRQRAERDGLVLVLARDRCLYVVDDQRGAAVGRHCGLHEPAPRSPLVATAETAVYLTTYGVVAYRLRTG